jgi:glycosyltransferase involved in cell wall biosynthesis
VARIGIDATAVSAAGKGHARTQRHLVESLAALDSGHELVAFTRHPEAGYLLAPTGARCVTVRERPSLRWELVGLPRAARSHRLDLVVTLSDRLPPLGGPRTVVWLFELPTHRIRANRESGAGAWQRAADLATLALWKRSLRRADRLLAGSRATARELEAATGVRADVLYPGLGDGFAPGAGRKGERYVLHLGSTDPRDNTDTAIDAFTLARGRLDDRVRLLVAGGGRPVAADGVEFLGRVTDAELADLYRGASAYLDATLYEGFGYGVLEAMACGAPVVASSATSIPEVVGEAGLLCDPRSPEELGDALARVLADPGLADRLRAAGLARAAEFTWERTARQLAGVIDEVLAA